MSSYDIGSLYRMNNNIRVVICILISCSYLLFVFCSVVVVCIIIMLKIMTFIYITFNAL